MRLSLRRQATETGREIFCVPLRVREKVGPSSAQQVDSSRCLAVLVWARQTDAPKRFVLHHGAVGVSQRAPESSFRLVSFPALISIFHLQFCIPAFSLLVSVWF